MIQEIVPDVKITYEHDPKFHKTKFVVLDGIDGSGKTTQAHLLVKRAIDSGLKVKYINFPAEKTSMTPLITLWRKGYVPEAFTPETLAKIWAIDRYEYFNANQNQLDEYDLIVSDRYIYSTGIHQIPLFNYGKPLPLKEQNRYLHEQFIFEFEYLANPMPDLTFILDIPAEEAQKRILERSKASGIKLDPTEDDLKKIQMSREAARNIADIHWIQLVDCYNKTVDDISDEIVNIVNFKLDFTIF